LVPCADAPGATAWAPARKAKTINPLNMRPITLLDTTAPFLLQVDNRLFLCLSRSLWVQVACRGRLPAADTVSPFLVKEVSTRSSRGSDVRQKAAQGRHHPQAARSRRDADAGI